MNLLPARGLDEKAGGGITSVEAGMAGRELEQVPYKPCKHCDLGGEAATSPEATGSRDGGGGDPGASSSHLPPFHQCLSLAKSDNGRFLAPDLQWFPITCTMRSELLGLPKRPFQAFLLSLRLTLHQKSKL